MQKFSPIRAGIAMLVVGSALAALIGRVAWLQTYGRQQTIRRAERQQHQEEPLFSRRGSIFDSSGLLMAGTVQTTSLFIDPEFFVQQLQDEGMSAPEIETEIGRLARMIEKTPSELSKLLHDRSDSRYLRIADNLDDQTRDAIAKMKLPGVGFTPVNVRYYPMGSLAAHVLGGVGTDGKGLEGIELRYEKELAGRDGYKRSMKDARRRAIAVNAEDYLPPRNGQHLILTVDANIQMIVEQELAAACEEHGAKTAEGVVMDPQTGDVLAMADWPTFNPQNLTDSAPSVRRNRCLDSYEPGSTIKPFIVGPSLQAGLIRLDEVMPIHGSTYKSPLRSKVVTDVHGYENLCVWDVLVKSSNIGMTMIGEKLGKQNVYNALHGWHFGEPTGIELPGEDRGLLRPVAKWSNSDLVSSVQGYSVMVTPLQLARCMSAYANGGRLIQPRIVQGVLDEDGTIISRAPRPRLEDFPEVVNPTTAAEIRRILADVPVRGTATGARSMTWNLFGKTGTAHVVAGGSYGDHYNASFVVGAPYENPRLIVAIVLHDPDPTKVHFGGTVSGPAGKRVLERSLAYLGIPKSPLLPVPPPQIAKLLYGYDARLYTSPTVSARE